jgi:hypothetical protein
MQTRRTTTARRISRGAFRSRHVILLGLLTLLFALRVLGQAIQRWAAQGFLPEFDKFQGSNLPYWLLLTIQLLILALMARATVQVMLETPARNPRTSKILAWLGGIYMLGSLGRLAVGLTLPGAPAWFMAWIPAAFHVVLAGFVLTLADYYAAGPTRRDQELAS